jgi:hypothetical protein
MTVRIIRFGVVRDQVGGARMPKPSRLGTHAGYRCRMLSYRRQCKRRLYRAMAEVGQGGHMKTRVIIEYDLPPGDSVVLRDREEQRWITSQTVLGLPGSAMVKVELLDGPLLPAVAPLSRRTHLVG